LLELVPERWDQSGGSSRPLGNKPVSMQLRKRQHVPPFGEVNRGALHSVLAHQNHSTSSFAVLVTMDVDDLVETDLEGVVPIHAATIR
jgi:hypothetical protein